MDAGWTRRQFVATTLVAGFAASVRPVAADTTITTAPDGLVAGQVKIGGMPAYRAMPEHGGGFPVLLVVEEIFGVHEYIRDGLPAVRQAWLPRRGARSFSRARATSAT